MKFARILFATTVLLLALPSLHGQENQPSVETKKSVQSQAEKQREESEQMTAGTPLKVQIVISEFDGTQKISSLPYAFNMLGTIVQSRKEANLRFGVRVPVATGSNTFTYEQVGTRIDATAFQREEGTYRLDLSIERSSVTMPMKGTDWKPGDTNPSTEPLIRSFSDSFTVVAKPGQTIEGTSAADPVTGHVVKVEVTLSVAK